MLNTCLYGKLSLDLHKQLKYSTYEYNNAYNLHNNP